MFKTSQLSAEQQAIIHQWAEEGATMSDIQRKMNETWEIRVTYMDTRFLILDLGITLKQEVKEEPKKEEEPALVPNEAVDGQVHTTLDAITIPGMLFSGKVTFSDGAGGMWYVDDTGRLGFDPDVVGYRPTPEDIATFQAQLKQLVR